MQQSRPQDHRRKCLKKIWKGYDDCGPYWKGDQLRGMDNQSIKREIADQIKDAEYYDADLYLLDIDY